MPADPRGDARAIIEVEMQLGAVGEIGYRLRHRISAVAQARIGGRALRADDDVGAAECSQFFQNRSSDVFRTHFRANGRRWHVFAFDLKPGVGPWDEIAKWRSFRKRNPHIETTVSRALISAPGYTCDGRPRLASSASHRRPISVRKSASPSSAMCSGVISSIYPCSGPRLPAFSASKFAAPFLRARS